MSYASVYTSGTNGVAINTSNIGDSVLKTSGTSGGNLPVSPATLVSGTQYTFCILPLSGAGLYAISLNFDVDGDNTTAFQSILVEVYKGNSFVAPSGLLNDQNFLVGTTLPNANPISQLYTTILQITDSDAVKGFAVSLTATFGGTAPTIPSTAIRIQKLT